MQSLASAFASSQTNPLGSSKHQAYLLTCSSFLCWYASGTSLHRGGISPHWRNWCSSWASRSEGMDWSSLIAVANQTRSHQVCFLFMHQSWGSCRNQSPDSSTPSYLGPQLSDLWKDHHNLVQEMRTRNCLLGKFWPCQGKAALSSGRDSFLALSGWCQKICYHHSAGPST